MNLNNMMKSGFLAAAVATLAPLAAHANTPTANGNDLFLGFYQNDGNGVAGTSDYLLNLGPLSSFNLNSNFSILGSNSHLTTDLATAFGSGWATAGDIYWGLVSAPDVSDVYVSNPNFPTLWPHTQPLGTAVLDVNNVASADSSQPNSNAANSSGLIQAATSSNSWAEEVVTGFDTFGDGGGNNGDGSVSDVLANSLDFDHIYKPTSGSGAATTDLGKFSLNTTTGDVTFATTAVPEPSTWASLIAGGAALLAFRRRRA